MGVAALSDREIRVAGLVAAGYSNRDIAAQLTISEQIVKNVVHSLFDKLGVWNRVELANHFSIGLSRDQVKTAQARIESDRLAELHRLRILDSSSERIFDEVTALAAKIFNVPIALIVLVDSERVWFKSNVGLRASEMDREITICHHTIQQSEVFVVGDTLEDARFQCIPPVVCDPKVRFYAAAPMISEAGYALGVVCVVDMVPREVSMLEKEILKSLARLTLEQMELRRRLLEVGASNAPAGIAHASFKEVSPADMESKRLML